MRKSAIFSGVLHLAILLIVVFGLPSFLRTEEIIAPIPVEIITIAEETVATPENKEELPPEQVTEPAPPKPAPSVEAPSPPTPAAVAEAVPEPAPEPQPTPEPEAIPEPEEEPAPQQPDEPEQQPQLPPQAQQPPQPEPQQLEPRLEEAAQPDTETEPETLPEPVPEPSPTETEAPPPEPEQQPEQQPEEVQVAVAPPEPMLVPVRKPQPPKNPPKQPEEQQTDIDFMSVLKNVEKLKATQQAALPEPQLQAPEPQQPSVADQPLTLSEIDALRQQIQRCWNIPAGARDAQNLIVDIRVHFNPDASIYQAEVLDQGRFATDGFFRAAAESALRAIRSCQPLRLPPKKYSTWQVVILTFDPSNMF